MSADSRTDDSRGRDLVTLARQRAPEPLKRAAVAGAEILGRATVPLRMQPAFLLAGTQRGGTTRCTATCPGIPLWFARCSPKA